MGEVLCDNGRPRLVLLRDLVPGRVGDDRARGNGARAGAGGRGVGRGDVDGAAVERAAVQHPAIVPKMSENSHRGWIAHRLVLAAEAFSKTTMAFFSSLVMLRVLPQKPRKDSRAESVVEGERPVTSTVASDDMVASAAR